MTVIAVAAVLMMAVATAQQDAARRGPPAAVTFTKDVAPILFQACATCHRPSGSAPFSLLTYDDARRHADRIVAATSRRLMPPWKPEPDHGEFAGERRLSDQQIALLRQWVEEGGTEGDPALLPPPPRWVGQWELGEPDLVLETAPYLLPAGGEDVYRNFVLPIPPGETRYVRAWQFLPGNPHVVHHSTMQFDATGASARLDAQDSEPGYEGLIPHTVHGPDGFFLGWTPGYMAYVAPAGMAWPLRPGTALVMMLHLRPHDRPERVQARLGLYFSRTPPTLAPVIVRLSRQDLDIPAGERRYVVSNSFTLDVDVDAYTVQPHAHNLAREVKAFATRPNGTREPLIYIRDWDFDWQGIYHYRRPLFLPAGTTITMEYVYDNSADNRRNPHNPPRRVSYGQQTTDEMAELWLQVVTRDPADRFRLTRAVEATTVRATIAGLEKMLERDPANAALHNDVALLYVGTGNLERAAAHFADTLRLQPASPAAHYNLGNTLLGQGQLSAAAGYFTKALALHPDYALAHDGLGLVRRAEGNLLKAIEHHRDAVRLDPSDADAHYHLAAALRLQDRIEEALSSYRKALQIDPQHPGARAELAALEQQLAR